MIYIFFLFIFFSHFLVLSYLQFTAWPEMFSYPYLLSNGFKMYKDIGFPYQPVLPLILEILFKFFGFKLSNLQFFTLGIILLNDFVIFLISLKIIGKKIISLTPILVYALIQPLTEGNMLWFDLATTPFILGGVLFLFYVKGYKRFILFGFMLSIAFFIKQQTGIIYLFLIGYLSLKRDFKEVFYVFLGSIIPAVFVFLYVLNNGIFRDYFFWTISVPLFWYPKYPGYTDLPSIKEFMFVGLFFIPILYFLFKKYENMDENFKLVLIIFLGAFISAFPRFAFFRFQPALALYTILLMYILPILKLRQKTVFFFILILIAGILLKENMQFFNLQARFYGSTEYKTSEKMNNFVSNKETVYLLNEHSLFYVLTGTFPSKPWVDNYVWYMEIEGMQDKVIDGFAKDPPSVIFRKNPENGNWYSLGTYEPKEIVEYIEQNYKIVDNINSEIEVWKRN